MARWTDLVDWLEESGVTYRVTSGVRDAGSQTNAGNLSCHASDNAYCDAIDAAGAISYHDRERRALAKRQLRAIFDAFVPIEHLLHELIYAEAPYNIRRGKRVAPYAVSDHYDHVHIAVAATTTLPERGLILTPEDKQYLDAKFASLQTGIDQVNQRVDEFEVTSRKHRDTLAALLRKALGLPADRSNDTKFINWLQTKLGG